MATRQTAAQTAAQAQVSDNGLPADWAEVESFAGHNPTDKADLIDVPFMILGAEIERNDNRNYDTMWVYAIDRNGNEFEFSDASSGIREQVRGILIEKGLSPTPGEGFQSFKMVVPRGLRVSEFKAAVTDDNGNPTGKTRTASTYYLTGSGRTAAGSPS